MTAARASEYQLARAFSSPAGSTTGSLAFEIASLYANAVAAEIAGALAQLEPNAETCAGHLRSVLAFAAHERVLGIVWCSAIGECVDALRRDDAPALARGLASWFVEAAALGCPGRWRIELGGEAALPAWDALVLPRAESLAVESDGATAHAELRVGGRTLRLALARDGVAGAWSASGVERAPRAGAGTEIVLLPRRAVPAGDFIDLRPVMLDPIPPAVAARVGDALELLRAQGAGYHDWVAQAFRALVVVASPERRLVSGSLAGKARFGYVSDAERPVAIGEMLVHEASHQYFHLLAKAGAPTANDDEARFYSPFVKTLRPLAKLVLAYHAFANVILFYERAAADGIDAEACERSIARLREDVEVVERTIGENATLLTEIGRGLFEPLKERLSGARPAAVH